MRPAPGDDLSTHRVANQPPDAGDRDFWADDPALRALTRAPELAAYGALMGRDAMRRAGQAANRFPPELHGFDQHGRRLDEVTFHPAWHQVMQASMAAGYHAVAWQAGGSHAQHAAMVYLASQTEPGHCCPLTMTYAAHPLLADLPDWQAGALSRDYDPRVLPAPEKRGLTLGMAMTEKQGGSDVRANTTRAERDGAAWRLTGHKWFCSAPMSDGFLTLAQTPDGLSCFLVPRWLPDGRNGIRLMRLKDKLGNRANASAEIEYDRALALPVGAQGCGLRTIVAMVHHTRLDTAMAPAGLMRAALRDAFHWAAHRSAFQKRLIDQPLMRAVLADLVLDWLGSLTLGMAVAASFDGTAPEDRAFARIGVALAKYMGNKLCPLVVAEAMEVLGGMGYVEETGLPLLYREAPLNGIWEGSGNVICLDLLRSLSRDPLCRDVLAARLAASRGVLADYDAALADWQSRWSDLPTEAEARQFAEQTALLLTAAVLVAGGHALAPAFIRTRLMQGRGRMAGAIPAGMADAVLAEDLFSRD
ncbi:acyl-CoA dehydrogenase family protein [Paracoccus shanxieyensis]|uniref:DNA alkylation response protein n=1 Tax=Paracoccus shanxieyensis TaxID=2675752 RepID=A0A6L6IY54_9RHOB|nr:acyl-CoA dehydrogenase family protein [Paracoccus shanxieyensis]MTH65455.1 DNA alkylation response protein [Paracoccus shanxieyensis]MTH88600.1 DNA alkylation response protein [Paracoccus shanxieyensis]